MSHSLRAKMKGLRYKGIITDKDCDRLCKALDNENVLGKIRAEIEALNEKVSVDYKMCLDKSAVLQIIDKYMEGANE